MIHHNAKDENGNRFTYLDFDGSGDIWAGSSASNDSNHVQLFFSSGCPGAIGREKFGGQQVNVGDLLPEVVMNFTQIESIDIIIQALIDARTTLHLKLKGVKD